MSPGTIRAVAATLRRFATHCGGSLTIPAIVFFAALMAVGGLAIDLQRYYGVHGQMQSYVDDVALAAAAELDAQTGALSRAVDAAKGGSSGPLLTSTGWQNFATTNTFTVQKITFLSALGTDPGAIAPTPATGDTVLCTYSAPGWTPSPAGCNSSANEKAARFVEVVASPRTVSYIILPIANVFSSVLGSSDLNPQLALKATAGFKTSVCDINPLMICNPAEPTGNTNTNYPFDATAFIGHQILLRASGGAGGGAWVPGDFGWVDIPDDAGTTDCLQGGHLDQGCELALANPLTQCSNDDTVNVSPGSVTPLADAINARFDIYPSSNKFGPANNVNTDARFAPSVNMTKGVCNVSGGKCNYSGSTTCPSGGGAMGFNVTATLTGNPTVKLPRDAQWCTDGTFTSCQATPDNTHRFGNGVWANEYSSMCPAGYDAHQCYWYINHGHASYSGTGLSSTESRWDVYRYEINTPSTITDYSSSNPNKGENGNKTSAGNGAYCSNQAGINTPNRDRRVLFVAVVNCQAYGITGAASKQGVKAVAYLKIFLTEPVGYDLSSPATWGSSNSYIFGEVVDVVKPNDVSGIVHVYPVLYR